MERVFVVLKSGLYGIGDSQPAERTAVIALRTSEAEANALMEEAKTSPNWHGVCVTWVDVATVNDPPLWD